jgi:hypothetical protein
VPAEEGGDPESGENDRLKTLRLLRETFAELQRQGQAKRKLVTLNEANEVARRLAATKAGSKPAQAVNDPNEDDVDEDNKKSPVPKDEVELWLC